MTETLERSNAFRDVVHDLDPLLAQEWLVTNGMGGYGSGTVPGISTRRYHGLLVAALPNPYGRTLMLNHLTEQVRIGHGRTVRFGGHERADESPEITGHRHLAQFRLEDAIPVWRYEFDGCAMEKRVVMPRHQNTVYVLYRLVEGDGPVRLTLRPSVNYRPHEHSVSEPLMQPYSLTVTGDRYEITCADPGLPPLRLYVDGQRVMFTVEAHTIEQVLYRIEERRGYDFRGDLWTPGHFRVDLSREHDVTLIASAEPWTTALAIRPTDVLGIENARRARLISIAHPGARSGLAADLVLAADQFVITPVGRVEHAARAHAAGDEVRSVIAGYHWFTDWGRDTMISLEGLTLTTGHPREAGYILRTFANYVRDGLIPDMFPEGQTDGLYHTADATLWFFHALDRYVELAGDRVTLRGLLPTLRDIVAHHLRGTSFNIHVDPSDGLLAQGAEGYQLTWMDAKVDDWVVTPRRGKAVEINALWYNALCLLARWLREEGDDAAATEIERHARRARQSFNARFWFADGGYLYDVVDGENGDDASCRPNQIFAISLPNPVLDRDHWQPVVEVVRERLVTPVGLRSLAPGDPDYKERYFGDLHARDAAYHQGTVWAWLIGPFVDAWLKLHPDDRAGARQFLAGFEEHMHRACVGSISEIFDAEAPFTPRGCIAQAWSVAEVLRCLAKTAPDAGARPS